MLIIGAVGLGLPVPGSEIVLGIALAWLGYVLATGTRRPHATA